jgi:hypothetical protein
VNYFCLSAFTILQKEKSITTTFREGAFRFVSPFERIARLMLIILRKKYIFYILKIKIKPAYITMSQRKSLQSWPMTNLLKDETKWTPSISSGGEIISKKQQQQQVSSTSSPLVPRHHQTIG